MNGNDVVSSFVPHIAWEKLPPAVQRKTRMALLDTLGATLIGTLTPVSRIAADLLTIGERILNAERLFNLRHGATRADDDLPDRFTEEPLPDGPAQGMAVPIQPMVRDFYAAMGWDADGRPTPEKLRELGL